MYTSYTYKYPSNFSYTFENQSIYTEHSLFTIHYSPLKHQDTISSQQRTVSAKKGKTDCSPTKLFTFRHQDTISSQQRTVTTKKGKTDWSQSQRTLHCYLEKDKTEQFPLSTKISALLHWKRQDLTVLHPNRELWKQVGRTVINSKPKPLIRTQDSISCQQRAVTTHKKMDCLSSKLFTFWHQDTISSQQRTVTTKKGKTNCISITESFPLFLEKDKT